MPSFLLAFLPLFDWKYRIRTRIGIGSGNRQITDHKIKRLGLGPKKVIGTALVCSSVSQVVTAHEERKAFLETSFQNSLLPQIH